MALRFLKERLIIKFLSIIRVNSMVKFVRTNFDFEEQLLVEKKNYQLPFSQKNLNYEFEYLYFFLNKKQILNTPIKYPSSYKEYLKSYFNINLVVENSPQTDYGFWWGDLSDFEMSKKLNDKKFFWEYCMNNNIPYPKTIDVDGNIDLLDDLIIARKRLGFSGIKSRIIKKSDLKILDNSYLYSNLLKRDYDFGVYFSESGVFVYTNEVDKFGQYKGSHISNNEEILEKINVTNFFDKMNNLKIKLDLPFQVDGFISDDKIYFNEMNYRQTMGGIFSFIREKYFPGQKLRLEVLKYSEYLKIGEKSGRRLFLTPKKASIPYRFGLLLEF